MNNTNKLKTKNRYGFISSVAMLILLLFPFYDDGIRSYSLISLSHGKVVSVFLILIGFGFYINLNKNYLNLLIIFTLIVLLNIVISSYLTQYNYNFATMSLIFIAFSLVCYFGFSRSYKKIDKG